MSLTLDATVEHGALKLPERLQLPEGTPVRVTITPLSPDEPPADPLEDVIGICDGGPPDAADRHDEYIYGDSP